MILRHTSTMGSIGLSRMAVVVREGAAARKGVAIREVKLKQQ